MPDEKKCYNCGAQVDGKLQSCPECKVSFMDSCPKCGKKVNKKLPSCPYCGISFQKESLFSHMRCRNIQCNKKINKKLPRCPYCGFVVKRLMLMENEVYVCVETDSIPNDALAIKKTCSNDAARFHKERDQNDQEAPPRRQPARRLP